MAIRRLFNDNPALTTAISIALLLMALAFVGYYLWPRTPVPAAPPEKNPQAVDPHAAAEPGCSGAGEQVAMR